MGNQTEKYPIELNMWDWVMLTEELWGKYLNTMCYQLFQNIKTEFEETGILWKQEPSDYLEAMLDEQKGSHGTNRYCLPEDLVSADYKAASGIWPHYSLHRRNVHTYQSVKKVIISDKTALPTSGHAFWSINPTWRNLIKGHPMNISVKLFENQPTVFGGKESTKTLNLHGSMKFEGMFESTLSRCFLWSFIPIDQLVSEKKMLTDDAGCTLDKVERAITITHLEVKIVESGMKPQSINQTHSMFSALIHIVLFLHMWVLHLPNKKQMSKRKSKWCGQGKYKTWSQTELGKYKT